MEEKGDAYLLQSVKHGGGGIMVLGYFVSTQAPAEIAEKEENDLIQRCSGMGCFHFTGRNDCSRLLKADLWVTSLQFFSSFNYT